MGLSAREFALQMAIERCKVLTGLKPQEIVDIAVVFEDYITQDKPADTSETLTLPVPPVRHSGKKSK